LAQQTKESLTPPDGGAIRREAGASAYNSKIKDSKMTFITQAIETKYMGPTNTRGSRIKATAAAGSVMVPFDYQLQTATTRPLPMP
jgi:hypothetical protein